MTRAMSQFMFTRAVYRRRYGTDLPEASVPSRFLEEVPPELLEELGAKRTRVRGGSSNQPGRARSSAAYDSSTHYSYEDEDQSRLPWSCAGSRRSQAATAPPTTTPSTISPSSSPRAERDSALPKFAGRSSQGQAADFVPDQKVRHPKYGEGTVYQREGEGEEAKITVQFPRFGLKKLVEKYAQLERASI